MYYCYHHPDEAASYHCPKCQEYRCDTCSNEIANYDCQCFKCGHTLVSLGSGFTAEPFWRRLDAMFRYGLNVEVMIFIGVISLLMAFLTLIPFLLTIILMILITGTFIKYCFVCLQSTAMGNMQPPSVTASYQEGLTALLRLLAVFILIGVMCGLAFALFGLNVGALVSVALITALPAALINLAMTDSILEAINPVRMFGLIKATGFAYGVLIAFILIMSSSVAILQTLVGGEWTFIGSVIQSFISYYYSVVMFHMMGYMIFQYQHNLGFVARDDDHQRVIRSDDSKQQAHVNMLLREGDFTGVAKLYKKQLAKSPDNRLLTNRYFEFLLRSRQYEQLDSVAEKYMQQSLTQNRLNEMVAIYQRTKNALPKFVPSSAPLRYALAQHLAELHKERLALPLLSGLHKSHPNFNELPDAYRLASKMLLNMNQPEQSKKLLQMVQKIEQKRQRKAQKPVEPETSSINNDMGFGGLTLSLDD